MTPDIAPASARKPSDVDREHFSMVFKGDLRALRSNPFLARTPIHVGFGNAFAEFDEFTDRQDDLLAVLAETRRLVSEAASSGFTDKDAVLALYLNNGAITAALARSEGQ